MTLTACPACRGQHVDVQRHPTKDRIIVECPNCRTFDMSDSANSEYGGKFSDVQAAAVSHTVFRMGESGERPYLHSPLIKSILENVRVPGHSEQADNLIRFLGKYLDNQHQPGGAFPEDRPNLRATIGAIETGDVYFVTEELVNAGFVRRVGNEGQRKIGLTFQGWDRYRELMSGGSASRTAFMAMQYRDADLDEMFNDVFCPAVDKTGFKLLRLDRVPKTGVIDNNLRAEIMNARFLLADLSHGNAGAYWEGGYAEGLGKPVIYLCEKSIFEDKSKRPHFDTNHCLTILWAKNDPEECSRQLKATIRVTLPGEAKHADD